MATQNGQDCEECCIMSPQSRQKYRVLSLPYSDLRVVVKFDLLGKQYLQMTFREEVPVAVVCHVSRCAQIHSEFQVTTEFDLLDGQYLWRTEIDWHIITGSQRLELPILSFTTHHSRQDISYGLPLLRRGSEGRITLPVCTVFAADMF